MSLGLFPPVVRAPGRESASLPQCAEHSFLEHFTPGDQNRSGHVALVDLFIPPTRGWGESRGGGRHLQASLVRQLGEDDTLQAASHQPPWGRRKACGSDPSGKRCGPSRQLGCSRALGLDCTPPELPVPHQHGRRLCPPEGSPLLPPLREFSCLARSEPSPPPSRALGMECGSGR